MSDEGRQLETLRSENETLRGIIRDMYRFHHCDCYMCHYLNECRARDDFECIAPKRIDERVRNAGVVVL